MWRYLVVLLGLLCLLLSSGCARTDATAASGGLYPGGADGSVLERGIARYQNLVEVRLTGATAGAVSEAFGKVVGSAPGVVAATRYASRVQPDTPQGSWETWRVTTAGEADVFRLQSEIMAMVEEVMRNGGYVDIYQVPYRYSPDEIALLKGLRPMEATSRSLYFVIDRELARDREMAGY